MVCLLPGCLKCRASDAALRLHLNVAQLIVRKSLGEMLPLLQALQANLRHQHHEAACNLALLLSSMFCSNTPGGGGCTSRCRRVTAPPAASASDCRDGEGMVAESGGA
eukprot:GHRQ01005874.1.p2 GENE.GHRQ01005874.1~~GHRQ01005874.1.p2  ORF type:complete len:108 (-),score=21.62 GHRQ01005874.1:1515-1838(-)